MDSRPGVDRCRWGLRRRWGRGFGLRRLRVGMVGVGISDRVYSMGEEQYRGSMWRLALKGVACLPAHGKEVWSGGWEGMSM